MKCQQCDKAATIHVTEIVADMPVDYHVCETHFQDLDSTKLSVGSAKQTTGPLSFWVDAKLRDALADPVAREKVAAYSLPALCLALLDDRPEVRVAAAFHLMSLGRDAESASGALRNALNDPDERVRNAARIALDVIQKEPDPGGCV
jgi:HEAT repeat protein